MLPFNGIPNTAVDKIERQFVTNHIIIHVNIRKDLRLRFIWMKYSQAPFLVYLLHHLIQKYAGLLNE